MVKMAKRKGRGKADFSPQTRNALAARAGFQCSFPGCGAPSFGPSAEHAGQVAGTGTACHIVAAADGPAARRVDPDMLDADRRAPENGIWMCAQHGKLIDTDEAIYTVEALKGWKALAERRTQLSQLLSQPVDLAEVDPDINDLAPMHHRISNQGAARETVRQVIEEAGCRESWGKSLALATRDLLLETAFNALRHGGATDVTLAVEPRRIVLSDDGTPFDWRGLPGHVAGDGGARAAREILENFAGRLVTDYRRENDRNYLSIAAVRSTFDLFNATHCYFDTDYYLAGGNFYEAEIERIANCNTVYLIPPDILTYSDCRAIEEMRGILSAQGKATVLLASFDISDGVLSALTSGGNLEVLHLPSKSKVIRRPEVLAYLNDITQNKLRAVSGRDQIP